MADLTDEDRAEQHHFWYRMTKSDGCWEWKEYTSDGYGRLHWHGTTRRAHRVAAYLSGLLPSLTSPLHVLHCCDNRKCCRPDHLYIGTNADNINDRVARGKPTGGEMHPLAKLTTDKAAEIRRLAKDGVTQRELARMFGVARATIFKTIHNQAWK